jgi:hypothetical protein
MIEIAVPPLRERELTLEPVTETRGDHEAARLPPLTRRIALGGPLAVPVTPDYVAGYPDLRTFVEQEAGHSTYRLVHLSVSFAAEPAAPRLEAVTLEFRLTAAREAPQPVAWSMAPLRLTDVAHVERSFRLGPHLKLEDVEVSAVEYEKVTSRQQVEVFLQAQRELRSDPAWEFRRTRALDLYGSHRLVMVVRAGREQATGISGTVHAVTKGNLLRRYRQQVTGIPSLEAMV